MKRKKRTCLNCKHWIDGERDKWTLCIPKGEHPPCVICEHFEEPEYADLDEGVRG